MAFGMNSSLLNPFKRILALGSLPYFVLIFSFLPAHASPNLNSVKALEKRIKDSYGIIIQQFEYREYWDHGAPDGWQPRAEYLAYNASNSQYLAFLNQFIATAQRVHLSRRVQMYKKVKRSWDVSFRANVRDEAHVANSLLVYPDQLFGLTYEADVGHLSAVKLVEFIRSKYDPYIVDIANSAASILDLTGLQVRGSEHADFSYSSNLDHEVLRVGYATPKQLRDTLVALAATLEDARPEQKAEFRKFAHPYNQYDLWSLYISIDPQKLTTDFQSIVLGQNRVGDLPDYFVALVNSEQQFQIKQQQLFNRWGIHTRVWINLDSIEALEALTTIENSLVSLKGSKRKKLVDHLNRLYKSKRGLGITLWKRGGHSALRSDLFYTAHDTELNVEKSQATNLVDFVLSLDFDKDKG
jgi:hypothetical protein